MCDVPSYEYLLIYFIFVLFSRLLPFWWIKAMRAAKVQGIKEGWVRPKAGGEINKTVAEAGHDYEGDDKLPAQGAE